MKLYDYGASANCLKVRILLAHLGLPYERVPVDIFAGESQTPEHFSRNPAGRTPVLELDSGETLAESNAILLFLARGTPYLPTGASGRGSRLAVALLRAEPPRTERRRARDSGASRDATSSDARPGRVTARRARPRSGSSSAIWLGTSSWSAVATPWPTSASTGTRTPPTRARSTWSRCPRCARGSNVWSRSLDS